MQASNPKVVISGVGLWHPEESVSNEELVEAYNGYIELYNAEHADAIAAGELEAKEPSTVEFINKASGIMSRYVYRKEGILDIHRMRPKLEIRPDEELSHQAEFALSAAREAIAAANKSPEDIDAIIVSCTYRQRDYPAIACEVQNALGNEGFAMDMCGGCSAGTYGLHRAYEMVAAGTARCVLAINPEFLSPQNNWRERDSHFIFGDVSTATIIERADTCTSDHSYEIIDVKAVNTFSNNIRCNFGYLSYVDDSDPFGDDKFFVQHGRQVFKEVCPMVAEHITSQLEAVNIPASDIKRFWLHQANIHMNSLIARRVLGHEATPEEAPMVLDEFGNTAAAGSLVAFYRYHEDLQSGDIGMLCSFGTGYSIGSLLLRKR